MRLTVVTPVTRPDNLSVVAESLSIAAVGFDITWHIRFDREAENLGGYKLKNDMLDQIKGGWIWFLDDDTLVHPKLFSETAKIIKQNPLIDAVVFGQIRPHNILHASPDNLHVGGIDMGQVIAHRAFIGNNRFITTDYCADGIFWSNLLSQSNTVYYSPKLLTYFNKLRPDAPS